MIRLITVLLAAAGLGYAAALLAVRRRAADWPLWRAACWFSGLAAAVIGLNGLSDLIGLGGMSGTSDLNGVTGLSGPAAGAGPHMMAGHHDFTAHMLAHLLLGMAAPLLLVLAAPMTLALRALPTPYARRVSRVLAGRPIRIVAHPVTALILNAGGMWLLYLTGLYRVPGHQLHLLAAGYLFTAAVIGVDPAPHRPGRRTRAAVLFLSLAAHAILAKYLYGHPPAGVLPADGRSAAELMYYGGDLIDVVLVAEFCRQWYTAGRPRQRGREPRPWRLPDDIRLGDRSRTGRSTPDVRRHGAALARPHR